LPELRAYVEGGAAQKLPTLRQCSGDTNPQKSGQDVYSYNRARTPIRLPPGQGCTPTPSTTCPGHVKTASARFW
ncbi:hypothetical protein, partial [Escherichia coli]|uniref:hypothetical protein n=1 Tax=Escherichia coli TaxID=562 RepID=UPI001BAE6CCD